MRNHHYSLKITTLILLLGFTPHLCAKIIYVDDSANGQNNGSSWQNAFKSLQDALATAQAQDQIRVAGGTYTPDVGIGIAPGDRNASFHLKSGVILEGGYAGVGQPKPNSRRPDLFPSILSGDILGNDVPLLLGIPHQTIWDIDKWLQEPSRLDNSRRIITATQVENTGILDGFTIANGHNDDGSSYATGIFVNYGAPTIRQCLFEDNVAQLGGSITALQGDPNIIDCTFNNNMSNRYGPAVSLRYSKARVVSCKFTNNHSSESREGGAVYIWKKTYRGAVEILNCDFENNYGGRMGGAIVMIDGDVIMSECLLAENYALHWAGAIMCDSESMLRMDRCIIRNNECGDVAGAILFEDSEGILNNCLINTNTSAQWGMIHCDRSKVYLNNCTLTDPRPEGIALSSVAESDDWDDQSKFKCYNCIFLCGYYPIKDIGLSAYIAHNCYLPDNGIFYDVSCVYGTNPGFISNLGNDGIPGTADDNFRLLPSSPCIDSGTNTLIPAADMPVDLEGRLRFIDDPLRPDTGQGTPPIVDMGVYEYKLGGEKIPVADASLSQRIAWAWLDGIAQVQLDGSLSYDEDLGDLLSYNWSWRVGGQTQTASGVNPIVDMPTGTHIVTLIVSDGVHSSAPVTVEIDVFGPFEAKVTVQPKYVNRDDWRTEVITVVARLAEIAYDDVDWSKPLTVQPSGIEAYWQEGFDERIDGVIITEMTASFDKDAILEEITANGGVTLTVSGFLTSGQVFTGTSFFSIDGPIVPDLDAPTPNPLLWAEPEADKVKDPTDMTDPDILYVLDGEPYALQINPRANDGAGAWALVMRAVEAERPAGVGGPIEYFFDCFEDNSLDRGWSTERRYQTREIPFADLKNYTFRVSARASNGGTTDWSAWRWIVFINDGPDAFRPHPDVWPGTISPVTEPDPLAPTPNPTQWAIEEPELVTDANDPNQAAFPLPGTPQAIQIDPRIPEGWALAMRAAEATNPGGGDVEYQFDCFENNTLDSDWSPSRIYRTALMTLDDTVKYTFRVRTRNKQGNISNWSKWEWIKQPGDQN